MEEEIYDSANRSWNSQEDRLRQPQTVVGLLRRLLDETSKLFRTELELARAEVSEALSQAKVAAISMASGGAVLFAGFLVLLAAAVLGLAHFVVDWLAALIVGAVVIAIGFIMIQTGKNKLQPSTFKPERTQQALREDKEMVQRRVS